jgi:hypothetical protein
VQQNLEVLDLAIPARNHRWHRWEFCNRSGRCRRALAGFFESCLPHFTRQFADELRRAFREKLAIEANFFPTDLSLG